MSEVGLIYVVGNFRFPRKKLEDTACTWPGWFIGIGSSLEYTEEKDLTDAETSAKIHSQISSCFTHFCCWISPITLIPTGI